MENYKNTQNCKTLNSYTVKKSHPYQHTSKVYFRYAKIQKSRTAPIV